MSLVEGIKFTYLRLIDVTADPTSGLIVAPIRNGEAFYSRLSKVTRSKIDLWIMSSSFGVRFITAIGLWLGNQGENSCRPANSKKLAL